MVSRAEVGLARTNLKERQNPTGQFALGSVVTTSTTLVRLRTVITMGFNEDQHPALYMIARSQDGLAQTEPQNGKVIVTLTGIDQPIKKGSISILEVVMRIGNEFSTANQTLTDDPNTWAKLDKSKFSGNKFIEYLFEQCLSTATNWNGEGIMKDKTNGTTVNNTDRISPGDNPQALDDKQSLGINPTTGDEFMQQARLVSGQGGTQLMSASSAFIIVRFRDRAPFISES